MIGDTACNQRIQYQAWSGPIASESKSTVYIAPPLLGLVHTLQPMRGPGWVEI